MIDGRLREWSNAFCTPLHYNHRNLDNRAAMFFYMWDDEALYIGLRCLDEKQGNQAKRESMQDGEPCRAGQTIPQPPQLFASVLALISQPSFSSVLQRIQGVVQASI